MTRQRPEGPEKAAKEVATEAPNEAATEAAAEAPTPAGDVRRRGVVPWTVSLLKKPTAWVVGVVLVSLGATFGSGLQNLFTGLLPEGWSDPGNGIQLVDVRRQAMSGPVLIPDGSRAAPFKDFDHALRAVNDLDWQATHEWYAVGNVTWEVTLVGRHSEDVVITDLRPKRSGPCTSILREGTVVEDVRQGGGGNKILLQTDLDVSAPTLSSVEDGSPYFASRTVTLSKGETVVIPITATSSGPTCRWVLEVDYVDHGKRELMTIKAPGGREFGITGIPEGHPYQLTWIHECQQAMRPEDWAERKKDRDYCPR
ncbi:hypothetical protein ACIA03_17700 [Nocardioides sp. NPDC051685]|uniref:hypothetical protein n=1 Tax=Nocardioides sp. NPDC051685 TaxID=3364334 RepID=UPI00378AA9EC